MYGHDHEIFLARMRQFERLAQVPERVVVAHQTERIVRSHFDALVGNGILRLQAELIHGAGCMYLIFAPAFVDLFRDDEDGEENDRKDDAADCGHFFSNEIYSGNCEE